MSMKTMRMWTLVKCVSLAAVVAVTASCGDVVRSSRSPVMVLVSSLVVTDSPNGTMFSDVVGATGNVADDLATASLAVIMKDATPTAPASTSNNRVTINRYHVEYRRSDGRNVPGVDVPHPFDGAATVTILPDAVGSLVFEIVRHVAKAESPLVQLRTNGSILSTIAEVTFYGTDAVGNEVSAVGSMLITFGNTTP